MLDKVTCAAGSALLVGLCGAGGALAEVSFKGKSINIIINSRAGGGTDASGHLLGTAFAKATKDKGFLKIVHNEIGKDYTPKPGAQQKAIVDTLVKVTKKDLEFLNAMKTKNGVPLE